MITYDDELILPKKYIIPLRIDPPEEIYYSFFPL